ncbi:MAG: mannose-phosphate guanylyltransferase [Alphaproteobacteria bacterium]|jgi:MurNAc alpha-1-phosphate uridylyltransferase|nr:mannose-phosphate guanylyltransferase [Alphaproteobacteria bacterium]
MTQVRAAMIMGAGLGSRMRPLTDDRPKPLVTVAGKALIDHSIDRLVAAGVTRIVVNLHYKAAMLRAHLEKRRDAEILFSDESAQLLDTGGGVVKALPLLRGEPFFVLNSDSIWIETGKPALPMMQDAWDASRMDGLLLLADLATTIGYDGHDFVLESDGRLARAKGRSERPYGYTGVQIVHPRLFADAPQGAFSTNIVWNRAIAAERLHGAVLDGVWLHVGTPETKDEAERTLAAHA